MGIIEPPPMFIFLVSASLMQFKSPRLAEFWNDSTCFVKKSNSNDEKKDLIETKNLYK